MKEIEPFDDRRDIIIPGNHEETILFSVQHFLKIGNDAIQQRGKFFVALSGGSTPKAIYQLLCSEKFKNQMDWKKVFLFWSDERAVPPNHPDSNYNMAMQAGFNTLPLQKEQIFRMKGEGDLVKNANEYETIIQKVVPRQQFDLIMLGMGEDGHTASLFPESEGLGVKNRLAIANFIPTKNTWRLSMTFECINLARLSSVYVTGSSKALTVKNVLEGKFQPDKLPSQCVGTSEHKALWILDTAAAEFINRL